MSGYFWMVYIYMKKPKFLRQESWRYKKLKPNWRKPKGIDNKMRLQEKGWPPLVKVGYRTPGKERGLHPSGLMEVLVHNVDEMRAVDGKKYVARLGRTVGVRKRAEMLKVAEEMNIRVLNPGRRSTKNAAA